MKLDKLLGKKNKAERGQETKEAFEENNQEVTAQPQTNSSHSETPTGDAPNKSDAGYSTDHLDSLLDELPDDDPVMADQGEGIGLSFTQSAEDEEQGGSYKDYLMDKEMFFKMYFCAGFQIVGALKDVETLKQVHSVNLSREASDAVYDTIMDVPMLHFLIDPQSKWINRAATIGMFGFQLKMAVHAELQAKADAAARQRQANQGEQGNQQPKQSRPANQLTVPALEGFK